MGKKLRSLSKVARRLGTAKGVFKKAGLKLKVAKSLPNRGRSTIPPRPRRTPGQPRVRNGHLAGQRHPVTGVPFDSRGFPDFSASRHPNVPDQRIKLTGNRGRDEALANAKAGLKETPEGYTWHHHQDSGLMQLIEETVHAKTGHTGGFAGSH